MAKFKVGDRVRLQGNDALVGTVVEVLNLAPYREDFQIIWDAYAHNPDDSPNGVFTGDVLIGIKSGIPLIAWIGAAAAGVALAMVASGGRRRH